jgi:transcriptional regulator of acetoin/glycerol metabolism
VRSRSPPLTEIALTASWQRCADRYRLDPAFGGIPQRLSGTELSSVRHDIDEVALLASEELDRLHALARTVGYATILAEPGGSIVERECRSTDIERFDRFGVTPGAVWREEIAGTNSIGTCVIEEQPVSVHRKEHYCRRNASFSSAGAPIFGSNGRLVAVLSLGCCEPRVSDRAHAFALAVVADWSRTIQERLFREVFRTATIIALYCESDESTALLAVDDDRAIIGANRAARATFGLDDTHMRLGHSLWRIFKAAPALLQNKYAADISVGVEAEGGGIWQALVTHPEYPSRSRSNPLEASFHTRARAGVLSRMRQTASRRLTGGGLSARARRKVVEHVDLNLGANICLEDLADAAGLSVHHFARAFKQTMGLSPHRYLVQQRVERAAELLGTTDRPLSQIALDVGFADQSHLSRNFTRFTGSTPNAFRRAQR